MPVRRGHLAPQNTFIDTIIRKFDGQNRNFIIANAQIEGQPIVFCNDGFCELTGFSRSEVMQRSAVCEFLHGQHTSASSVTHLRECLQGTDEKQIEMELYKRNGQTFTCSLLFAPVRNEHSEIILFILNFEDMTNAPPISKQVAETKESSLISRLSFRRRNGRHKGTSSAGHGSCESAALLNGGKSDEEAGPSSTPRLAHRSQHKTAQMQHSAIERETQSSGLRRAQSWSASRALGVKNATATQFPLRPLRPHRGSDSSSDGKLDAAACSELRPLTSTDECTEDSQLQRDLQQLTPARPAESEQGLTSLSRRDGQLTELAKADAASGSVQLGATANTFSPTMLSSPANPSVSSTAFSTLEATDATTVALSDAASAGQWQIQAPPPPPHEGQAVPSQQQQQQLQQVLGSPLDFQRRNTTFLAGTIVSKPNVTRRVAQVLSLGADVLPEYKLQPPKAQPFVILHFSLVKAIWDWFILALVLYTAIVTPYVAAFLLSQGTRNTGRELLRSGDPITIIDLVVDITFLVDILVNFRTTYVNRQEEVVSNPGKIAAHYFKGWFLIDMLSAIPFDLLLFSSDTDETTTLIGLLKTARLLRLVRVARKLDRYSEYGAAVLILLMATFTLFAHWLACIFYAIAVAERPYIPEPKIGWIDILSKQLNQPFNESDPLSGPDMQSKYITALYFTFSSLTSVGFGNISPNTNVEKIFTIIMMLVGSLMYASIFGNVSAIIQRLYSGTARYHNELARIKEFIRFHQIPNPLRQRLEEYFQHAWSYTNGIDMNTVLKGFPECLQADICLHLNKILLTDCPAFKGASPGCLRALSMKFRTIHVPPGDTLVHRGDVLNAIYFVSRGSVEILKDDMVMAILGKGDVFGEHICRYPTVGKSSCNVRALTYCDLHKVLREDLIEVLEMYPEFSHAFDKNLEVTFNLRDEELTVGNVEETEFAANGRSRWKMVFRQHPEDKKVCPCPEVRKQSHSEHGASTGCTTGGSIGGAIIDSTETADRAESGTGILEFSPAMAGHDVTPLNLDFSPTKKPRRPSAVEGLGTAVNSMIHALAFGAGGSQQSHKQLLDGATPVPPEETVSTPLTSSPATQAFASSMSSSPYGQPGAAGWVDEGTRKNSGLQSVPKIMISHDLDHHRVESRMNEMAEQLARLEAKLALDMNQIMILLQERQRVSQQQVPAQASSSGGNDATTGGGTIATQSSHC